MKRKVKKKPKIKPTRNIIEYIGKKGDIINYDFNKTPVIDIAHSYQAGRNVSEFQCKNAFEKKGFPENQDEIKSCTKNKAIKILNIVGYLGITVGCMYQCFSFLTIYFKYPTTVEMNVTNDNIMDFPAVTVCNSNP